MSGKKKKNGQAELIDDMLSSYQKRVKEEGEKETTDGTETSTETGEASEEEIGETEAVEAATETESEDSQSGEQEPIEKPEGEEEAEEDDKEGQEDEVTRLRKTIEEMSSQKPQFGEEVSTKKDKQSSQDDNKETSSKQKEDLKEKIEDEFSLEMTEEQFNKVLDDPKAFTDFLMRFGNQVRQQAREDALRDIPDVVSKTASRQQQLLRKRDEFYTKNKDLENHKNYVGYVANQIYSNDPDMSLDELFNKTAVKVRKDLAINEQAVEKEDNRLEKQARKSKAPAFAGGTHSTRSSAGDNRTELQKEFDAMLNLDSR